MSATTQNSKRPARELRVCRAIRLLAEGMPERAVAAEVRVTRQTMDKWQQDAEFRALLKIMREHGRLREVLRELNALSMEAVNVLKDKLNHSDDRIAVQVARDVLDRIGATRGARVEDSSEQVIRVEYVTRDGKTYASAPWAERHPPASGTVQGAGDGAAVREDGDR